MASKNIKTYIVPVIFLAVALLIPVFVHKAYYIHVLTMCLLWAYLACSWNIIGGFAGQLSLGHGMYTAVGAYVTVILFNQFGISPWLGMFVGGAGAVLLSMVIGYPTFTLKGAYYALATVAVSEGVLVMIQNTSNVGSLVVGGAEGLMVKMMGNAPAYFQFMSKVPYYYIMLIMLLLIIFISRKMMQSRLGYYLLALKEDEDAAGALGINVRKTKLMAAGLSAFLTALGGVFYAQLIHYLEPSAIAGAAMSTQMVFLAIVGGSGTILGPVIGGISLSLISEIVRFYLGDQIMGLHLFIYGMIILLVIIYKPRGIIESLEKYYNRFLGSSRNGED